MRRNRRCGTAAVVASDSQGSRTAARRLEPDAPRTTWAAASTERREQCDLRSIDCIDRPTLAWSAWSLCRPRPAGPRDAGAIATAAAAPRRCPFADARAWSFCANGIASRPDESSLDPATTGQCSVRKRIGTRVRARRALSGSIFSRARSRRDLLFHRCHTIVFLTPAAGIAGQIRTAVRHPAGSSQAANAAAYYDVQENRLLNGVLTDAATASCHAGSRLLKKWAFVFGAFLLMAPALVPLRGDDLLADARPDRGRVYALVGGVEGLLAIVYAKRSTARIGRRSSDRGLCVPPRYF